MLPGQEVGALRDLIARYRRTAARLDDEAARRAARALDAALRAVMDADGSPPSRRKVRAALDHARSVLGQVVSQ